MMIRLPISGGHSEVALSAPRHFPPPWSLDEHPACFIVRDANWQPVCYFYFDDDPHRRAANKSLTKDEAQRIAAIFAKLPDLLQRDRT